MVVKRESPQSIDDCVALGNQAGEPVTISRMLKKAVQQDRSERRGDGVRFGTLSL